MYDNQKRLVQLLLAETQKVAQKTQTEFNEKLHEKYQESFREEKLLIEKRNGKIKKQLETKRVRKWIKFKSNKHIVRVNTAKKSTHLASPKRKGNVPSKGVVFYNEDQSEETLPSKENLKLVTDNRQQRKRNKIYADVVVNITDNSVLCYNTKSDNDATPNRNKKGLTSTGQKSTMSKEELKSVCNLLLSEDSLTAEPRPPVLIADTSISDNISAPSNTEEPREEIQNHDNSVSDMDEELLSVLINLQNAVPDTQHEIGNPIVKSEGLSTKAIVTDEGRLQGSFCSKTVFNLSQRVLSEIEIQVLEKGLDFAPIQKSINEPELRKDFEEFSRRMRIRWNFRDQPSEDFSDKPAFRPKSNWKPPPGHPGLELFLSQLEKEIFNGLLNDSISIPSNMPKEEWEALRGLADDRSIVINQADKLPCVVVWCRDDYYYYLLSIYLKLTEKFSHSSRQS